MLGALLLVLVTAAPVPLARAQELATGKQWDELYLAFATAKPAAYPKAEAPRLAALLALGCEALLREDAVLAQSLGEKSAEFGGSVEGVLCGARAALTNTQRSAAEGVLRQGLKTLPKEGRFALELGRLLLEDNDAAGALAALALVGKGSPAFREAQALKATAQRLEDELQTARAGLKQDERAVARQMGVDDAEPGPPEPIARGAAQTGAGNWESSVDEEGRRQRGNAHFRFRYFNGQRDFGQRAEYEGAVQGVLDDARTTVKRLLGEARETPLDVILYSRQEFAMHHGAQAAQAVAGFYSQNAIRMNDSAQMSDKVRLTMVHEYTHAVFDELASFKAYQAPTWINEGLSEYIEWLAQGQDHASLDAEVTMRNLAAANQLPSLAQMTHGPLVGQANPALLYALSGTAVRLMVARCGVRGVVELVRNVGRGTPFPRAFAAAVGQELPRFEETLQAELRSR